MLLLRKCEMFGKAVPTKSLHSFRKEFPNDGIAPVLKERMRGRKKAGGVEEKRGDITKTERTDLNTRGERQGKKKLA